MMRLKFGSMAISLVAIFACLTEIQAQGFLGSGSNYSADSLPAFKSDTAALDPFRNAESSGSPFAAKSALSGADTGAGRIDSVTRMYVAEHPESPFTLALILLISVPKKNLSSICKTEPSGIV